LGDDDDVASIFIFKKVTQGGSLLGSHPNAAKLIIMKVTLVGPREQATQRSKN